VPACVGYDLYRPDDNGWSYDPDNNSITFHGEITPTPDEDILVSYPLITDGDKSSG